MKVQIERAMVDFDPELYRALSVKAAEIERTISDLVNQAVRLSLAEDAADLAAFEQRRDEPDLSFADVEVPESLFSHLGLPKGVDSRLQTLLDRQDHGEELTSEERQEAEGLVDLAEMLSLIKLRARRRETSGSLNRDGNPGFFKPP